MNIRSSAAFIAVRSRLFSGFTFATLVTSAFLGSLNDAGAVTTNYAATCQRSDVLNALNKCANGDVLIIPAGTAVWTTNINVTKNIQLFGAGMDQTIITNEVPLAATGSATIIIFNPVVSGFIRVSGFTIAGGTTNTAKAYNGQLSIHGVDGGTNTVLRVDHVKFEKPFDRNLYIYNVIGVVDHCVFHNKGNEAIVIFHNMWAKGGLYGDGSYATPVDWGGSNTLFIETCEFTNATHSSIIDSYAGARYVMRYCNVTNENLSNHGTESSQRYRGNRSFEFYMNNWADLSSFADAFYFRSGSGVVFSNTMTGFQSFCAVVNYRACYPFTPWGGANGTNAWDYNSPGMIASGTHTGTNNSPYLEDANANWQINQWVGGYTVVNSNGSPFSITDMKSGTYGSIATNSLHRIYCIASPFGTLLNWSNGQPYQIYSTIAQLDQPGRGAGDLIKGDNPINTKYGVAKWPNQEIDPIYQWGNTFNGKANPIISPTTNLWTLSGNGGYNIIKAGRDYYDNTPKPGYTPYMYPHPLTLLDTPSATRPSPPTNLRIQSTP